MHFLGPPYVNVNEWLNSQEPNIEENQGKNNSFSVDITLSHSVSNCKSIKLKY